MKTQAAFPSEMSNSTPIFDGKVDDEGALQLDDHEGMKTYIQSLRGRFVEIIVRVAVSRRSNQQNRWLWGVCYKLIADELGWDIDDVHAFCKSKFNPVVRNIVDKTTGETEEAIIGGSTRKMTTHAFSDYKEAIQAFFANYGIVIPDPNQTEGPIGE